MNATGKISHHWQLDVYKLSIEAAMRIFDISKKFPREEMYSLTDQMRIIGKLVTMGNNPEPWLLKKRKD